MNDKWFESSISIRLESTHIEAISNSSLVIALALFQFFKYKIWYQGTLSWKGGTWQLKRHLIMIDGSTQVDALFVSPLSTAPPPQDKKCKGRARKIYIGHLQSMAAQCSYWVHQPQAVWKYPPTSTTLRLLHRPKEIISSTSFWLWSALTQWGSKGGCPLPCLRPRQSGTLV